MTFLAGDVIGFYSSVAGKHKFHLCLGLGGTFLFINTPKSKQFLGDLVVDCSEIPCINPTASGKSVISCSMVIRMTAAELAHCKAKKHGAVSHQLLQKLLKFVEASPVLSPEDKEAILDGIGDAI